MIALAIMPLIAHAAILHGGWRLGWIAVGLSALVVGLVPTALLMVRRPEDAGLLADPHPRSESSIETPGAGPLAAVDEPSFTRAEALATPAFWMLALFTLLIYPVQAGVSLHQAPHLIERGLDSTAAALIVAIFSLASAFSGLAFGPLIRRAGIRWALALVAVILGASSAMMIWVREPQFATLTAALYGVGIGGLLTGLPLAWVETFGRRSFGAIRGAALSIQVAAQAAGPLISGALRDWTGDYVLSLWTFAVMAALALASALLIRPATR